MRPPTRAYHLRRAACLTRAGDQPGADRERRAADGLKPLTAFDHFLAGQERFARKDFAEASQEFDMALQLQPDHFWAQALSAVCSLQLQTARRGQGRPERLSATGEGVRVALHSPRVRIQPDGWDHRDLLEKRPGREAVETIDRLTRRPTPITGRAMKLLDRTPNEDLRYSVLVNRGVLRFVLRRDLEEAVGQLQAAIRLKPRELEAHAALAKVFQSQDQLEEAVEQFSRAIELSPRKAALYRDRADVDLSRAQIDPGAAFAGPGDLEQAIRLEAPDNPVLARDHYNRARLLALDHHDSEALEACDAAIKVDRDYDDAHRLRIELLLRLKRYDDVIRSCDPLIARGKATSAIYELRGLAREEIKDFAGAIEDFTNAMALGGNRATLLRRRGWLYIVADAPQLALHDFEAAIRLDATSGDAYNGRGSARLRLGEHRQAVADAEKALSARRAETGPLLQGRARVRRRGHRRRGRGPQEGAGDRDPGLAISGSRRGLAPRGAQAASGRTPRVVPERRDPHRSPVADASPPHFACGSGRSRPVCGQVAKQLAQ